MNEIPISSAVSGKLFLHPLIPMDAANGFSGNNVCTTTTLPSTGPQKSVVRSEPHWLNLGRNGETAEWSQKSTRGKRLPVRVARPLAVADA